MSDYKDKLRKQKEEHEKGISKHKAETQSKATSLVQWFKENECSEYEDAALIAACALNMMASPFRVTSISFYRAVKF